MFEFDFLQIGRALFFIYFVGFLAPISVSIFLRSSGQRVYPVKLITIYGYAYFIYLIATCVALIPSNMVKMIAMGYAGVTSLIHILISFSHETKKQTTSLRVLLIICIYVAVSQPIILLIIKENYFHHIKYGV